MNRSILIFAYLFLITGFCIAQEEVKYEKGSWENGIQSGDIKAIFTVTKVNIIYEFKDLVVGARSVDGKGHLTEADYLKKKSAMLEKDDKSKVEEYKKNWEEGKAKNWLAEFEIVFNKYAPNDIKMTGTNNSSDAEYNLIVRTTKIEPGYRVGMGKMVPYIDAEFIFTDKSGTELLRLFFKSLYPSTVGSAGFSMWNTNLAPSYGKAAKKLVEYIQDIRKGAK